MIDITIETHIATVFRFRAFGEPAGAMKLLQPVLRRALHKQFAEHCASLKRVLEEGAP